jgi:hypothetical protein
VKPISASARASSASERPGRMVTPDDRRWESTDEATAVKE